MMGGVIVALVVLLWIVQTPTFAQPLFSPAQDPISGSHVFGIKGCSKCHSINGVGGKVGPDLGRIQRPRSFYDLAAAMWNHLPRMVERMRQLKIERPFLTPWETGHLIAFLYTLNYFDPPGNAQAGKRLFTEKRCVVCHQVAAVGGVVGPNLDFLKQYGSPIFIAAAMWNHGPGMAEAMRTRGIVRPTFSGSELLNLIGYLKSAAPDQAEGPLYILPGRPEQGRWLFVQKRCIECHSVAGEGGKVGPDLADRALHRSLTEFAAAMWNKAPAMTAAMRVRKIVVPRLEAEEMADIVAYLYSVQYFAGPGDPKKGQQIAVQKGCLACHAPGFGGAPDFSGLRGIDSPATVIAAMWNHSFISERRLGGTKVLWPEFRPEEMAAIIAFLQAPRRERQ